MPKWLKYSLRIVLAFVGLVLVLVIGFSTYVYFNKAKVIKLVNAELTKNLDGTLVIGDMQPQFLKSFPDVSLRLKNVTIRDKRYNQHHHTFLDAQDFDVAINARKLFSGVISIGHISISNAAIDIYTDSTGYSNSSVFKKDTAQKSIPSKTGTDAMLGKFTLTNVGFKVDDRHSAKLFDFIVNTLDGTMAYPDTGWHAAFHMDVLAKSMTFKASHGSFIKGRNVEGDMEAGYSKSTGNINVTSNSLDIGDVSFKVNALFELKKKQPGFAIHLAADKIQWRTASSLLSANITEKLNQFNIAKPIAVTASISAPFEGGDPLLYITAAVKDNTVSIPGSTINNCSFDGVFSNNYVNGKGLTDENSVIKFSKMTGSYHKLPFTIDAGYIVNLDKPIATGNFKSSFPVADLGALLGNKVAEFKSGEAVIKLNYKADIVDYRINKPFVAGSIDLKNADIVYKPDNLVFNNTNVSLRFVGDDLLLRNIRLQTGRSVVVMNGSIHNFLNLYYSAPEKILLNLNIGSRDFYLGEFLGFLGNSAEKTEAEAPTKNSGNIITQLNNVLQKGNADIRLDVATAHYNKFTATDLHAEVLTTGRGMLLKTIRLKNSGGSLELNGEVKKGSKLNSMSLNSTISNVDVRDFFFAFDNFGMTGFTYQNLRGSLSAKANITAGFNNKGLLQSNSINGVVNMNLKDGHLINFKPLQGVGKLAFPFRDLKNISVPSLDATFTLHGDRIEISPMQISSSVLNLDVAGTYGLTTGTNITMDIPLRNPKNDSTITDQEKLKKKRYRGIVLHLLAKSDETGKVKIGFNKEKKE